MKPFQTIALGAVLVFGAAGQKLETQKADPAKVIRVETAKDHLTVIELADTVTMVAVGNRSAFTVERRENKVFVTPTDESARTNLFIWTSGGRFSYELVPAASVELMHFAIDQPPAPVVAALSAPPIPPERIPSAMLTEAVPVLVTGERDTAGRVEVAIRDLYRRDRRLYLRYAFINRTSAAYQPVRPAGSILEGAKAQQSLISPAEHQLGERIARTIKSDTETVVEILDADQAPLISPGGQGWGWLVVNDISSPAPDTVSVLKMQFAADSKGTVDAFLVLSPAPASEVARARRHVE
ncbi:MAG: TrbG/VirB9 family P-type conjugative transfer protein [Bryobacterales bacterium]|nr:TrbG/VirB9 family P-type conjugative transfer protein [Bryobacterales bacterium]